MIPKKDPFEGLGASKDIKVVVEGFDSEGRRVFQEIMPSTDKILGERERVEEAIRKLKAARRDGAVRIKVEAKDVGIVRGKVTITDGSYGVFANDLIDSERVAVQMGSARMY